MSSSLLCRFCEREFNAQFRVPRLIAHCGHSICAPCLEINLKTEDHMICVEDEQSFSLVGLELSDFPINQILLLMLERSSKSQVESNDKRKKSGAKEESFGVEDDEPRPKAARVLKNLRAICGSSLLAFPPSKQREKEKSFKKDEANETKKEKEQYEEETGKNSPSICVEHKKKIKAVCMEAECRTGICSYCGLYGAHKVSSKESRNRSARFF